VRPLLWLVLACSLAGCGPRPVRPLGERASTRAVGIADAAVPFATSAHPAVLLVAPAREDGIDREYMQELRAHGFAIDWTETLQELTRERVRSYNAIVLFTSPEGLQAAGGPKQAPGAEEQFNQVVQEYLATGGGVLLMPEEKNIGAQRLRRLTDAWGAQVAAERVVETDAGRTGELERGSHRVSLAYT
jgi:hypothetical protein